MIRFVSHGPAWIRRELVELEIEGSNPSGCVIIKLLSY